ncbi:MAG: putative hydro-lyase [Paracoccus sp. (in: a-proteobacteria)]|uniref:putative hydro-lyase n=1 Tax=Paracoccus sp. TaxID=267 RepID=UPI0026DEE5B6|nr:putative hydro-lyase [Paracoccus sp. (in: a-proteobacteria)]MDO5622949.1 putative hydro-lyase [Paracoccus sp. (in: a-proteobacteria)]
MQQAVHLSDPRELRAAIRRGDFTGPTAGFGGDALQANMVILPAADATDFLRFCQMNPRPCPLLAVGAPGDLSLPSLGHDIDLCHDVPRYRLWRDGRLMDEPVDIAALWRDDLVSFALGCSFSFEDALARAGVPLRHQAAGRNVAMYRTNIQTRAVGRFSGPLVVSMRPMPAADAIEAAIICNGLPLAHGAPVHLGDPAQIGIPDLMRPDYGDAPDIHPGDVPVFWACGVTPQAALEAARLPFAITHAPGHMLVTDIPAARAGRILTGPGQTL